MEVDLPILRILSLRAGGLAYCSRDGSFGVVSDRDEVTPLGPKAIPVYAGNLEGFLLSPDGSGIQFAYERFGKSPAIFSVNERLLSEGFSSLLASAKASFAFQAPITDGMGVTDWKTSTIPQAEG